MTKAGYKVHVSHVSRVLKGERVATKDFVTTFAKVIGVTTDKAREMIEQAVQANKAMEAVPLLVKEG